MPSRDHAEFELALEPALAHDVPALVELPPVLRQVLRRRLVRRVGGAEREVGEERAVGPHADAVGDHPQRLVDQILREVVALVGPSRRRDRMVVGDELGMELVGLALHEPVEPVEAPTERPLVERAGRRTLLHRGEVPLADGERGVAGVAQHLGHRGGVVRDVAEHVGEPGAEVRHRPHPDGVLRASGEQRRPRRRAQRGHVEVRELQPAGGERVDVRCVDVRAVATELGESGVVEQHDHHVGCLVTRMRRLVVERRRLGDGASDRSLEA